MAKYFPAHFQVPGFLAAGIAAGIKKNGNPDLALIYAPHPAVAAGVFTTNRVKAAPVILSKERLKGGYAQAVLINSGCANACTGLRGLKDAQELAKSVSALLKIDPTKVLLASTGVIGRPLPVTQIKKKLPLLISALSADGLAEVARAIVTTDTFPKAEKVKGKVNGQEITLAGIAKGAGMISPQMATMLSFVLTDAWISPRALKKCLQEQVKETFNLVIIDGDMSTNDTVLVLANGQAQNKMIEPNTTGYKKFSELLRQILYALAEKIARDGEGATKLVKITVEGARSVAEAQKVARTVACSPLVKTAFFGADANWGRIMCAAGYAGVNIDPNKIDIFFDKVQIVGRGQGKGSVAEKKATEIMKKKEYEVRLNLHQGRERAFVLTTDLSYDYVKINAAYRT